MTGPDGTGDAAGDLWVRLLGALERPCPVCGGGGRMRSREWRAWRARTDELVRVVEAARRAATMPAGDGPRPGPPEIGALNGHGNGHNGSPQGNGAYRPFDHNGAPQPNGAYRGNGAPQQRDPYDTDPYRSAPYDADPYQSDAYPGGAYADDRYPDEWYAEDRYGDDRYEPDPYPIDGDGFYDGEIDPGEGMLRAIVARAGRQPVPRLPDEGPQRAAPPAPVRDNRPARPATGPQPTVPIAASNPPKPPAQAPGPPAAIVSALDRAINEHIRARPTGPEVVPCEECRGSGRTLTEAGAGLTQFLRRQGLVWADPGLNGHGGPPVQRRDGPFPPSA